MLNKPQETNSIQDVDIAIVGAGIVGLAFALSLAKSSLKIAIIDNQGQDPVSNDVLNTYGPRVSALTLASQHLFSELGVWDRLCQLRICAYKEMFVWDAEGTGSISFSAADIHQDKLGYIIENKLITLVLNEALAEHQGVQFLCPENVDEIYLNDSKSKHQLFLKGGKTLSCNLVIGADGGNSLVRKKAGFETKQWDYQHHGIVTTVKTALPHQSTARQRFMSTGPLAYLPLSDLPGSNQQGHYSSIVWSCVPSLEKQLMELDDEEFAKRLASAFENKLGAIESIEKRYSFPLRQMHAIDYVQSGVALIGDAAHTIHPLAGQGVNLGLLDVVALSKVILDALNNSEDFASLQTLSRYQRKRKGGNLSMMMVMEGFKHLFASDDLSLRWLRNYGLNKLDNMPMIKNKLMAKAMGL